jgi:CRISPR/Cas system Type II protein with McrA/HNH and RuvC-like nuclease domain
MGKIIGLDVGIASIGFSVVNPEQGKILAAGAHKRPANPANRCEGGLNAIGVNLASTASTTLGGVWRRNGQWQ